MSTKTVQACRRSRAKNRLRYNKMSLDWHRNNRDRILKRRRDDYVAHPLPGHSTKVWYSLLEGARRRAKKRGIECTIDGPWLAARWTGKCELTGIEFRGGNLKSGPSPRSPSIDRIDREKGYIPGNCRVILFGVNALKGCGTDEEMRHIARALIA